MAMEDDVSYENSFNFTFDELFEAFNELIYEFNKLRLKNMELKKINFSLIEEKNFLAKKKKNG